MARRDRHARTPVKRLRAATIISPEDGQTLQWVTAIFEKITDGDKHLSFYIASAAARDAREYHDYERKCGLIALRAAGSMSPQCTLIPQARCITCWRKLGVSLCVAMAKAVLDHNDDHINQVRKAIISVREVLMEAKQW